MALPAIRRMSFSDGQPLKWLKTGTTPNPLVCVFPALAGLIGSWDASVFASLGLTGSTINTIADQSGAGNNLSALGTAALPTYNATGLNGKPSMVFSLAGAENSALANSSFTMGTGSELMWWACGSMSGFDGNGRMLSYTAPGQTADYNNVHSWAANIGALSQTLRVERNNQITPVSVDILDEMVRWIGTISSSGEMVVYVDGVAYGPPTTAAGSWTSGGVFVLGRSQLDPIGIAGEFGEFGVCSNANTSLVSALDDYLVCKWAP